MRWAERSATHHAVRVANPKWKGERTRPRVSFPAPRWKHCARRMGSTRRRTRQPRAAVLPIPAIGKSAHEGCAWAGARQPCAGREHGNATHHTAKIANPKWKWRKPTPRSTFWDGRRVQMVFECDTMNQPAKHLRSPPDFSYVLTGAGDSQWFGDVCAPLAEKLEEVVPFHTEKLPEPLRVRTGIVTNDWDSYVMVGITFFIANRIGGKALDDVYTHLIQPRFKALLAKIDKSSTVETVRQKRCFR